MFDDLPRDAAIADIPCGTGRLGEVLLQMGFTITGIDIARPMLEVAARRLERFVGRFDLRLSDARELGEIGRKFDATLCARVLMHFPLAQQVLFLRSITNVTTRRVVFTQGVDTPYHRLRRRLKRLLGHQVPARYPLTNRDLLRLIKSAGLREIRRYRLLPVISEAVVVVCEPVSNA